MPQIYFRYFLLSFFLFTLGGAMQGQNIRISQGGRINTCTGIFYDAGGANGDHSANGSTQTITLCSNDGGALTHMRVTFQDLAIDGTLRVFNGDDITAPEFPAITDADQPGFSVAATESNNTGCLTFLFVSTGSEAGWAASISCTRSCQTIEGLITSVPASMPDADGYIDICPGEEITLTAEGVYPENNSRYSQSDATSIFTWNFQDGTVLSGRNLTNVSHTYEDPGGYSIQLIIEDADGCTNTNRIRQKVRVAPPPLFTPPSNLPGDLCVGEEITLTVGRTGGGNDVNFNPTPVEFTFTTSQTRSELTELPDGNGTEYSSPLVFSNFNPGQTLGQASDIVRICATMEHSYLGDLDIWITCPDGSRLDLHNFERGNSVERQLLGQGDQNTVTADPPGLYCWTASAPRTMTEVVTRNNVGSNETMPEIDYAAEESFNTMVGCPLNGEWSLNIRDNLTNDNGYIYEWSIEFANSLYPEQESFFVPVNNFRFEDFDNYNFYGTDSVIFAGQNPGPNNIRIVSTDDYGCVYDTAIVINVLPPYDPACNTCGPLVDRSLLDTAICLGESFTPEVAGAGSTTNQLTFESYVNTIFGESLFPRASEALSNIITVSGFTPDRITNVNDDLLSVCLDLENAGDLSDVTIQLRAPNGRLLTLIENFGGNGEDLNQTCFSPTAAVPLSSGSAPYTGSFQPSGGGWTAFNTSQINGDWELIAWDDRGNDIGELLRWSISFNYDRGFTYAWTPNDGNLSCTDCPNPTITPTGPTSYTLNVMTADGCTDQATVNISINTLDVMVSESLTNPTCPGTNTGVIDLTVTGNEAAYFYAWSDGPATTEDRTNLAAGMYTVSVSNAAGCEEVFTYELTERPTLTITLDEVIDVSCFGGSTGEIRVSTAGGTPPYTFLWDDPNAQDDEDAGALTSGSYNLVVTDAVNCTATFNATVDEPDDLTITFRSQDVACLNGNDGFVVAVPAGGNGGYTYAWSNSGSQDSIFNLSAGAYEVTVTDRLGCMAVNQTSLQEPATPLTATIAQTEQGCFDASANHAEVSPTGGSPGYSFLWSNGEITAEALALPSGQNSVTVTDAGGCSAILNVVLQDLPEITINIIATVPSCNDRTDGRLGVIPSGGAGTQEADYMYQWSNSGTDVAIINLPGDVLYRVTVTGPRGCTGEAERFLPAPPPITFTVDETPVTCFGESNGGLAITNISGPNVGNFDLQWNAAAGGGTSPTISGLPAGTNYGLMITDVEGCSVDTILRITEPPVLGASLTKADVSCFGESDGRLSALGSGGVGGYQYAWSTGSNQNQLAGLPAGTYTLTVTDANQCEDITTIEVLQPDEIFVTATSEAVICQGEATGTIFTSGTGGRQPYLFGLENQGFSRNSTFIGLPVGTYMAFIRDSSGCQASTTISVADGPDFSLVLPADSTIIFGDSIDLIPIINGGIDTIIYDWQGSYEGTLSCLDCPEPVAMPEYEIDYSLVITDGNGCAADGRFRVSVRKIREVAVPTGFTPNGDLQNDRLIVHGRPGTKVISFAVYDRWANLLYEANDFDVNDVGMGWDGTSKDAPVNAGVYLYKLVIEYEDASRETLSGETTLIR
ncbi:MAG: proprotein convertase P-domain-containing protein [Lewinella sp.]